MTQFGRPMWPILTTCDTLQKKGGGLAPTSYIFAFSTFR